MIAWQSINESWNITNEISEYVYSIHSFFFKEIASVVIVRGPSGSGKTFLACQYCKSFRQEYRYQCTVNESLTYSMDSISVSSDGTNNPLSFINIRWVFAGSLNCLSLSLRDFAFSVGMNIFKASDSEICTFLSHKINSVNGKYLIVVENVDRECIPLLQLLLNHSGRLLNINMLKFKTYEIRF